MPSAQRRGQVLNGELAYSLTLCFRRLPGLVGDGLGDLPERGVESWLPGVPLTGSAENHREKKKWLIKELSWQISFTEQQTIKEGHLLKFQTPFYLQSWTLASGRNLLQKFTCFVNPVLNIAAGFIYIYIYKYFAQLFWWFINDAFNCAQRYEACGSETFFNEIHA